MGGHPPAPWTCFPRRLRRVCRVLVVDEHITSKMCCGCRTALHTPRDRQVQQGVEGTKEAWEPQRCDNWACDVRVVNRDVKGAINILLLLKLYLAGVPRPAIFGGHPPSSSPPPSCPLPPPHYSAIRADHN